MFIQENAFENVVCEKAAICPHLNVLIPPTFSRFCHPWYSFWVVAPPRQYFKFSSPLFFKY